LRTLCPLVLLCLLPTLLSAQTLPPRAGRSVVMAPNGMVATSQPIAAQVGLEILRKGGNAVDAAIATDAALGLMEPMSCGVGGDLYALVWNAKTQKLYALNASGRSPYRATLALFAKKGLGAIPSTGPLSWSVPGCVDGWDHLRQRFGTMPLTQLLEPTIRYAEEGFPVSEIIAHGWQGYDLDKMGAGSADYWHLFLEAKKLAYSDRAKYYTDPAFASVPTAALVSKAYAAQRSQQIDMAHAGIGVEAGAAKVGAADTIYLCVVDKDRGL
jgi:gamma-glutamyltranspeptidase/glutathione hydrolase